MRAALAAAVLALAAAPAAEAASSWRMTAELEGRYANEIVEDLGCPARFATSVDGLRVSVRSGRMRFDAFRRSLVGTLTLTSEGGRWTGTGSYQDFDGDVCGPPASVACSGAAGFLDGREAPVAQARGIFAPLGGVPPRGTIRAGVVRVDAALGELGTEAGLPEATDPCPQIPGGASAPPCFGLTSAAQGALLAPLQLSIRKLKGRRPFTVATETGPEGRCPAESGSFALRTTFRPD
jgi:hypothetical protein